MKILLVVPYQTTEPYIMPNLGLGYIAAAVRHHGHEVRYLDCIKERLDHTGWAAYLKSVDVDVIGIQMYSYAAGSVLAMMRIAKEIKSTVITVAGGPHVNAIPGETLAGYPEIDYIIHGEGEQALPRLLDGLGGQDKDRVLTDIPNLAYRDRARAVRVNPREYIDNLDGLDWPAWDLMPPPSYPRLAHGLLNRRHPIAAIFATRGCPYSCVYCSAQANMGSRVRKRSPANIVAELEHLVTRYGVREVHFEDDNFTLNRNFAKEVCRLIISRKLDIVWACPNGVRLDSLDEELLKLMEQSGCYSFALGIESGSDRILQRMKKGDTNRKMRAAIQLIAKTTRIRMTGFIIIGFPGETEEDLALTEHMVLSEPLHRIAAAPFVPLPGTVMYDELVREGKIDRRYDWSLMSIYEENMLATGTLTSQQISSFMKKLHLKFYLRPRIIINILREINSLEQFMIALKLLLFWLGVAKMKKE